MTRGGVSETAATNVYAADYSAKRIYVKSAADFSGNDLVIHDADADSDGLPDIWELSYVGSLTGMNQFTDTDGDGLLDVTEFQLGTKPNSSDSDSDGLPDAWEVAYNLDPLSASGANGAAGDPDGDGRTNAQERSAGTNPMVADSDADGLSDGQEATLGTNPLSADSDGDGLPDGWEVTNALSPTSNVGTNGAAGDPDNDGRTNGQEYTTGTKPVVVDTDLDGLADGYDITVGPADPRYLGWAASIVYTNSTTNRIFKGELSAGSNPLVADSDSDGLNDGYEIGTSHTNPLNADSDGDGMGDGWEVAHGLDPASAADAADDPDSDGLTNYQESLVNSNPHVADTDGDSLNDGFEVTYNFGGLDGDPAGYDPYSAGGGDLNPTSADTDGDGFDDGTEYSNLGTMDPLNPDLPVVPKAVSFTERPKSIDSSLSLAYRMAGGASSNVMIESTLDLTTGSWSNELNTNLSLAGAYTNLVPAAPGSRVKFFRIRFAP